MTEVVEYHPATDPGAFSAQILGRELWDHQLAFARSKARYRVVCAGRQVGKSTTLSAVALFEATTRNNVTVLLVSAGEVASRRLLEECTSLALNSPMLSGSVLDDSKSILTLSNGSRIISVPASSRQIRGWPVDVLILDEAGFIDTEIWRAAEPAIIARPGSRVIMVSTPWGGLDHFFRQLWQRGMDRPSEQVESWHWPSTVSPLVDAALLEQIRERESPDYFRREFLAEWTDEAGAYFTEAEIMSAVADYELVAPEDLVLPWLGDRFDQRYTVAAGIDWGFSRDANALTMVSVLEDFGLNQNRHGDNLIFYVPWLEAQHNWSYADFIDRIVESGRTYRYDFLASEVNGVGAYPTDDLSARLQESRVDGWVGRVWTDAKRKQSGFSKIKGLLQRRRLVLPNHPELLKQLRGLEFEQLASGSTRIAVPDRAGHDDLVMSLMQAVSLVYPDYARRTIDTNLRWSLERERPVADDLLETRSGLYVPRHAKPVAYSRGWAGWPEGVERGNSQW
ncbi:terminase large subunit domain-containing protein [Paenarthrobacter ureafaciens]|uniref:terminase large subunit domain-containing protein n=1 Tax=Paenarthrobacter ureafaciens TaxID=37931 RepID=UPI001407D2C2|nr:terminase family protein [Paenarthrobacter ureafaciens]MCX8454674.1 terminase family protein [Paenarthrobacter ureafaciens]MCY0974167.1 terminase family protein [Paenarthrobacter ureafaciens]